MKTFIIVFLLCPILSVCFSKTIYRDSLQDTIIVKSENIRIIKSDWAYRFNAGISKYNYGPKTAAWLGNHYGPDINFSIYYKNFRAELGFKPWTVNPNSELTFKNDTLSTFAELNPIKTEITIGYNLSYPHYFDIEPYIGYLHNSFVVINEDELKKKYDIPSKGGLTIGCSIFKEIFEYSPYQKLQLFFNSNYNFSDFSKVNSALDSNFMAFEIGISFQGSFVHIDVLP
ncbi:MAG TPA: hypothetical protein VHO03_14035 [Ignavibacteriales bacterium]|nr:hypothetical protein [Ignavibacteriales bacterium]